MAAAEQLGAAVAAVDLTLGAYWVGIFACCVPIFGPLRSVYYAGLLWCALVVACPVVAAVLVRQLRAKLQPKLTLSVGSCYLLPTGGFSVSHVRVGLVSPHQCQIYIHSIRLHAPVVRLWRSGLTGLVQLHVSGVHTQCTPRPAAAAPTAVGQRPGASAGLDDAGEQRVAGKRSTLLAFARIFQVDIDNVSTKLSGCESALADLECISFTIPALRLSAGSPARQCVTFRAEMHRVCSVLLHPVAGEFPWGSRYCLNDCSHELNDIE